MTQATTHTPRRVFRDRREAGRVLARRLQAYPGKPDVHAVLGTAPLKTNSARLSIAWRSHFTISLVLVPHAAHATRPWSCHRLGPLDLPFKSKRYRHGSVAVPVVSRGGFIAVGSSQQRAQP